jgi:hypothetical protein
VESRDHAGREADDGQEGLSAWMIAANRARPPERRFTAGAGERTGGGYLEEAGGDRGEICPTSLGRRRTGPVLEIEQRRAMEKQVTREGGRVQPWRRRLRDCK